jgi:multiple sugar transport system substrate-binding protein
MGMDLIYAPQFERAGQLVDITDKVKDWPELKTASPGHMTVATYHGRIYGVPLYADVSALFYNIDLFELVSRLPSPASSARFLAFSDSEKERLTKAVIARPLNEFDLANH